MAKVIWTGGAKAVKQVSTVTIALTWADADYLTLTINGRDLVITIGTLVTVTQVAATVVEAFNGTALTDTSANAASAPPIADSGGQGIPEFYGIVATSTLGVVTLTGGTLGKPFTMTSTPTTAGNGTAAYAVGTAATGPNHADNGDNWDTGTIPADTNDIIFDDRGLDDVLYGLDQNGVSPASITITNGFVKYLGLLETNADSSANKYPEYLETYLKYSNSVDATTCTLNVRGEGTGSRRIKLDFGTGQTVANISSNGQKQTGVLSPPLLIKGTHASNIVNVMKGDVGIAFFDGDASTVATLTVGFETSVDNDSTVVCGDGMTLTDIDQSGGSLTINDNTTTIDMTGGTLVAMSGTHASLDCYGPSMFDLRAGTITTGAVGISATLDFSNGLQARTVTNALQLYPGATLNDPNAKGTYSANTVLNGGKLSAFTLDLGPNRTIAVS